MKDQITFKVPRTTSLGIHIPWRPILIGMFLLAVLCLAVWFLLYRGVSLFKPDDVGGVKNFTYSSSLLEGTKVNVNFDTLSTSLIPLVQVGTGINIQFRVENGKQNYVDSFVVSSKTLLEYEKTNQRTDYLDGINPELAKKVAAYQEALNAKPFRVFVIVVDVTDGYKDIAFQFAKYLSPADLAWINDPTKESIVFLFAIGYNPIPGYISWDKAKPSLKEMEMEAQAFLSPVGAKPLPNTSLFSGIHYVMDKVHTYYNPMIVVRTDSYENTMSLSEYKPDDKAYKSFIAKDIAFMNTYKDQALKAAGLSSIDITTTATFKMLLPSASNSALGQNTSTSQWYDAVKTYMVGTYPNLTFTYGTY